jgi:hypothetical protein
MGFWFRIKNYIVRFQERIDQYDERVFIGYAFLIYFIFAAINIAAHEMWFDEMQSWLIAVNSSTLTDLFSNLKYEGHPPLWHICLYFLSRITSHPGAMQFFHLMIASSTAYIFLKFAPFNRLQRLLFIFGYFPLYEYATISRSYSLGILFIFLFCVLFRAGIHKNYLKLSFVLFLLSQTSAYGFIIAVSFALTLTFEILIDKNICKLQSAEKWELIASVFLVLFGLFASATVMIPESDSGFAVGWTNRIDVERFQETLASVFQSIFPIPRLELCYWNRNIIPGKTTPGILALPLLYFLFLSFVNKRVILFLFSFSFAGMVGFQYFKYLGYLRHFGHFYIIFIVCLWLEKYYKDDLNLRLPLLNMLDFCKRHKETFLYILLSIHFAVGIFSSEMDWFCPFSASKNTAKYIKDNDMDKLPIVGQPDIAAASVAGYLNRQFYYPMGDRFGSFIIFDRRRLKDVSEPMLLEKTRRLSVNKKSDVVMVLNYELETNSDSITKLKEFHKSIVSGEKLYLYLYKYIF